MFLLITEESKTRFTTKHVMEGRAPMRVVGSRLLVVGRGGNSIQLHDMDVESKFKKLDDVKVGRQTSMFLNSFWSRPQVTCIR